VVNAPQDKGSPCPQTTNKPSAAQSLNREYTTSHLVNRCVQFTKTKGVIAMAYVQIIGVFIAALFGLNSIVRGMVKNNVPASNIFAFAVGCAMATCGMFL
jgi:hypothetical protein